MSLASWVLDLVYPRRCELCSRKLGAEERAMTCATCAPHAEWILDPACPRCGGALVAEGAACRECAGRAFTFRGAVAAGKYQGFVRDLVHRFKFESRPDLARPLAEVIAARLRGVKWGDAIDVIVPVPMRRMKLLFERRYNPAELLAARLGRELDRPVCRALAQVRATTSQTQLTGEQRLGNPKGAYAARRVKRFHNRGVLLVDDVLTTGATASECARTLKDAGAAQVWLAVVGR